MVQRSVKRTRRKERSKDKSKRRTKVKRTKHRTRTKRTKMNKGRTRSKINKNKQRTQKKGRKELQKGGGVVGDTLKLTYKIPAGVKYVAKRSAESTIQWAKKGLRGDYAGWYELGSINPILTEDMTSEIKDNPMMGLKLDLIKGVPGYLTNAERETYLDFKGPGLGLLYTTAWQWVDTWDKKGGAEVTVVLHAPTANDLNKYGVGENFDLEKVPESLKASIDFCIDKEDKLDIILNTHNNYKGSKSNFHDKLIRPVIDSYLHFRDALIPTLVSQSMKQYNLLITQKQKVQESLNKMGRWDVDKYKEGGKNQIAHTAPMSGDIGNIGGDLEAMSNRVNASISAARDPLQGFHAPKTAQVNTVTELNPQTTLQHAAQQHAKQTKL